MSVKIYVLKVEIKEKAYKELNEDGNYKEVRKVTTTHTEKYYLPTKPSEEEVNKIHQELRKQRSNVVKVELKEPELEGEIKWYVVFGKPVQPGENIKGVKNKINPLNNREYHNLRYKIYHIAKCPTPEAAYEAAKKELKEGEEIISIEPIRHNTPNGDNNKNT